jgi:hypothetical protein
MYEKVWRYIELEKKFEPPDFLSKLHIAADLIIQPFGHLFFWACFFAFPALLAKFGYAEKPTFLKLLFYVISGIQVIVKMVTSWGDLIEYYQLGTLFLVTHIKFARGYPHYVINSPERSHQLFRYAAAEALSTASRRP